MEFVRGDTEKYKFQRKDANGEVITTKASKIYFTVKKDGYSDDVLLQKTIDDMTFDSDYYYHFTIEPEDTDEMEYGTYRYDIEVIQNGVKKTTVGEFILTEEITFTDDEV